MVSPDWCLFTPAFFARSCVTPLPEYALRFQSGLIIAGSPLRGAPWQRGILANFLLIGLVHHIFIDTLKPVAQNTLIDLSIA